MIAGTVPLAQVARHVRDELAERGRDPHGPAGRTPRADRAEWWHFYEWVPAGTAPRQRLEDQRAAAALDSMLEQVTVQVAVSVFSGAGRDAESLGIGFVVPGADTQTALPDVLPDDGTREQTLWGAIRRLGLQRYFRGGRQGRSPHDPPPSELTEWLHAVADRHGVRQEDLIDWARRALPHNDQLAAGWVLNLNRLAMRSASEGGVWRCVRCAWPHLHANAGVASTAATRCPRPERDRRAARRGLLRHARRRGPTGHAHGRRGAHRPDRARRRPPAPTPLPGHLHRGRARATDRR